MSRLRMINVLSVTSLFSCINISLIQHACTMDALFTLAAKGHMVSKTIAGKVLHKRC